MFCSLPGPRTHSPVSQFLLYSPPSSHSLLLYRQDKLPTQQRPVTYERRGTVQLLEIERVPPKARRSGPVLGVWIHLHICVSLCFYISINLYIRIIYSAVQMRCSPSSSLPDAESSYKRRFLAIKEEKYANMQSALCNTHIGNKGRRICERAKSVFGTNASVSVRPVNLFSAGEIVLAVFPPPLPRTRRTF